MRPIRSGVFLRSRLAAPLGVLAALLLLLALAALLSDRRARVVHVADSEFGRIRVTERSDGLRTLYIGTGRARQSAIYPGRPMHLEIEYTRVAMVGLALTPEDGRILFVGLGGGAMPMYARQVLPRATIEVVEIDPAVVEVAQRYFGFRPDPRLIVHTGDGRAFIEAAPARSYDLIVLDAFSDDEIPVALTTRQFLEDVRFALTPDGVVVSNLWTAHPRFPAMVATYRTVFGQVQMLSVGRRPQRILLAAPETRPLNRAALLQASTALARRAHLGFDLPALVRRGYTGSSGGERRRRTARRGNEPRRRIGGSAGERSWRRTGSPCRGTGRSARGRHAALGDRPGMQQYETLRSVQP